MHRRRVLLVGAAMVALTGGLTACGGDGLTEEQIAQQIDANPSAGVPDPFEVAQVRTPQEQADADAKAAAQAQKRRKQLERFDRLQEAETKRILEGEGAPGGTLEESAVPIGTANSAVEAFRARVSGVCDGVTQRIGKVTKETQQAAESGDAKRILEATLAYNDVLNDFQDRLDQLNPPGPLGETFEEWKDTLDTLSSSVRLWLVSQGDAAEADRLQKKVGRLTARFIDRSARLGITCVTGLT